MKKIKEREEGGTETKGIKTDWMKGKEVKQKQQVSEQRQRYRTDIDNEKEWRKKVSDNETNREKI